MPKNNIISDTSLLLLFFCCNYYHTSSSISSSWIAIGSQSVILHLLLVPRVRVWGERGVLVHEEVEGFSVTNCDKWQFLAWAGNSPYTGATAGSLHTHTARNSSPLQPLPPPAWCSSHTRFRLSVLSHFLVEKNWLKKIKGCLCKLEGGGGGGGGGGV